MPGAPIGNLNGARWTADHDAFLRARLLENMSMAAAAAALNAEFGTAYSRNACIGRAGRQNMDRNNAMGPLRRKLTAEKPKPQRVRVIVPKEPTPEMTALRCVEVEPLHVELVDLQDEHCRWPYGEGPFTFCGNPVCLGTYCGPHFALSVGPGTNSERAANRVSRKQVG